MQRLLVLLAICAGCGEDLGPAPPFDLEAELAAIEGVTVERVPTQTAGYQYFVLRFEQPVDHANPDGAKFRQRVSLLHRDSTAPMIALTSGYWDFYGDQRYELTSLLGANQISIEHRYFGESRPANPDWTKLTIEQMAHDEHVILTKLRHLVPGGFISTGGSKGGMTAVYHRRFFPDDVRGTMPYVAPISFGAPDPRYVPFLDTLGPPACREAVRAAALELLQNRRAQMVARAEAQAVADMHAYTRIAIGPAVESAITSLEWAYWQYAGVKKCQTVPPPTASDDTLWAFLDAISPVSDNADERIAQFEAYYYQAYAQLGFPDSVPAYLEPHLVYTDRDYDGALPTALPAYDGGAAMTDIANWVQTTASELVFLYGEWDPWTGGRFAVSSPLIVPQGTHNAQLSQLEEGDRQNALLALQAWSDRAMAPQTARSAVTAVAEPRLPSAMLRARRGR